MSISLYDNKNTLLLNALLILLIINQRIKFYFRYYTKLFISANSLNFLNINVLYHLYFLDEKIRELETKE